MKIRYWGFRILSVCLSLGLAPMALQAQGTATTGSGTSSTAGTTGAASGGSTGTTGINLDSGSGLIKALPILAATNTSASTTTSPSTSNPFYNTMVNPYSLGYPGNFAANLGPPAKYQGSMGKGFYINAATTTISTTASTTTNAGIGFNTAPTPRAPVYYTVLGDGLAPKVYADDKLAANLKNRFEMDNGKYFKHRNGIQVEVKNGVVLLRGQVATETERTRAEGWVRTTRGVANVQNELQVVPMVNN